MKRFSVLTLLGLLLGSLVLFVCGCGEQLGETTAEGHRRHIRNVRLNNQQMAEDIDMVLLTDEPSRLTDKRIP